MLFQANVHRGVSEAPMDLSYVYLESKRVQRAFDRSEQNRSVGDFQEIVAVLAGHVQKRIV